MDLVADRNVLEWDEADVHAWFSSLGFTKYEMEIREHGITGEVLCMLNADSLKAVGVSTIGQRLAILKAVYLLKVAHNVPIDPDDYVPPSEASERLEGLTIDKLHAMVKEQGNRLGQLEEENRQLNQTLQLLAEDLTNLRSSLGRSTSEDSNPTLRRQPSFKWAQYVRPAKSPTKADLDSPHPSPQQLEHDLSYRSGQSTSAASTPPERQARPAAPTDSPNLACTPVPPKTARTDSSELKSFKVSLEDPTWKVLPAALKKYRINNDNWENYAMFICYGSTGNRIERCLSYDEKPLLLFQKLKDAKKNPVFMLKHIKDIRSPIAVAQQKHAARKASSVITNGSANTSSATLGHAAKTPSISNRQNRPPRLEVDLSASAGASAPGIATAISPAPGWPESGMMSPSVERAAADDALTPAAHLSTSTTMSGATIVAGSGLDSLKRTTTEPSESTTPNSGREMPPVSSSGVSYAVAIYPYMAEQEDEFDVVVGDTFIILSRARGWWVVQRDPTGSGIVDADTAKQGWVPAGCLLETNVPVASAIAEATAAARPSSSSSSDGSPPDTPTAKTPILPLSIISTSFPGIALMDYKKKGEEELDLVKDDALRVFKRYNHWSYAVKEEGGDRGWVPSWFIGKVSAGPATPNTSVAPPLTSAMDDPNQAQVSPMSSAFPTVQSSRSVAVN